MGHEAKASHEIGAHATPAVAAWKVALYKRRFLFLAATLAVVLALDQASKLAIRAELARPSPVTAEGIVHYVPIREIRLIDGIFHLRYVENPAAAFSLTRSIPAQYRRPLLLTVSTLAMILLLWWMRKMDQPDVLLILGFSLVLGGAVGNATDRLLYHYVIDFVDWRLTRFFPTLPPWPTFNIADSAIVCGAGCIILRSFMPDAPKVQADPTPQTDAA